jgi:hypothetical protein
MKSGGGSFGHLIVQVSDDWCTHLSTYDDHSPILDVDVGSTSVSVCIAGRTIDQSAADFARELAAQAAKFAAEVERLHGLHSQTGEPRESGADTEAGEAT